MHRYFSRTAAALAITALAACGGGGNATTPPVGPTVPQPITAGALVGIGDSLTAGYQSSALLGDPTVTSPLSSYPGGAVPPGQFSGFWADMFNQMTGTPNAAAAVLPLIKGPGLGGQLVLNKKTLLASTHLSCDAFNQAAYSSSAWQSVRVNPSAGVADLGVPGITMHEAVSMTGPITGPQTPNATGTGCNAYPAIPGDPTSGGLQSLVSGESEMYYPVLGGFKNLGSSATELNAALSLNPKLTTVWLGANDLLKFAFSAGTLNPTKGNPVTDTPQQLAADLTQIVTALTKAGSKVLVADLPTLLPQSGQSVPQFFSAASVPNDLTTLIVASGGGAISPAAAAAYTAGVMAQLNTNPNLPAAGGWYLTETGFFATLQQAMAAITANPAAPNFSTLTLDPNGPNSGLGGAYLNATLVGQVQTLNTAYNTVIDQIANGSGKNVALVPITALFNQAATSGLTIAPGETLSLKFGGGLVSWDGLHPSNTGYAVIANAFIQTADTAFGMSIPALSATDLAAIANGGTLAIGTPVSPDPYNPFVVGAPFPLP